MRGLEARSPNRLIGASCRAAPSRAQRAWAIACHRTGALAEVGWAVQPQKPQRQQQKPQQQQSNSNSNKDTHSLTGFGHMQSLLGPCTRAQMRDAFGR